MSSPDFAGPQAISEDRLSFCCIHCSVVSVCWVYDAHGPGACIPHILTALRVTVQYLRHLSMYNTTGFSYGIICRYVHLGK